MIDLFSVKLNGEYDEIAPMPTIQNGTFLCSDTVTCDCNCGGFVKGYSYQITNGKATRTQQTEDFKIQNAIYPTIQNICEWLNNWFVIRRNYENFYNLNYEGYGGGWHEVPQTPVTGDLCKIRTTDDWNYISQYSFIFVSYVTVEDGVITADNPKFQAGENYFYYIMHLPQDLEATISKMMYYDAFNRGMVDGLKSENIGNYSYTKEEVTIGGLAYPKELIAGIESNYKKVKFIQ